MLICTISRNIFAGFHKSFWPFITFSIIEVELPAAFMITLEPMVQYDLGKVEEALQNYKKAIELSPE